MSSRNGKGRFDPAGYGVLSILLATAIVMLLSGGFSGYVHPLWIMGMCISFGSVFIVSSAGGKYRFIAAGFLVVVWAFWLFGPMRFLEQIRGLGKQVSSYMQTGEFPLEEYATLIALLLSFILTALIYWIISGGSAGMVLYLCVMLLTFVVAQQSEMSKTGLFLLMTGMAVATSLIGDKRSGIYQALPLALLVAFLSILLLPAGGKTWAPMEDLANKTRQLFHDYLFFTDPRTTYSISENGFQNRGELLGGPADPLLEDVMEVETDTALYLRGAVKRNYTNYSWTESNVNSRYVFIDPTRRSVRDEVFDSNTLKKLGLNAEASGAFRLVQAKVTMLREGISALYIPHRLTSMDIPLDLVTYFNSSGEVFLTRGVQPGDTYTIKALVQTEDTDAMRRLLEKAAVAADTASYMDIAASYTELPRGIDARVYQLVQDITRSCTSSYDKALAIQKYLATNCTYALDVKNPPRGEDFVSYFVLKSRKGYCSYFATAMAVMAKIAQLPARYVQGYLVPVRENGHTVVEGKNAHAWVEIYFPGAGWITFDPTPGNGDSFDPSQDEGDSSGDSQNTQGQQNPEEGENKQPGEEDSQDPEDPQDSENSENSENNGDSDTEEDESEQDGNDTNGDDTGDAENEDTEDTGSTGEGEDSGDADGTADPENEENSGLSGDWDADTDADADAQNGANDTDADEQQNKNPEEENEPDRNYFWLILGLLLLALVAAGCFIILHRLKATRPEVMAASKRKALDRLAVWYRALLLALEQQGQTPAPTETPLEFAQRLAQAGITGRTFTLVAGQLTLNRYAGKKIDPAVFDWARAAYEQVIHQFRLSERIHWLKERILHGLGDIRQIP